MGMWQSSKQVFQWLAKRKEPLSLHAHWLRTLQHPCLPVTTAPAISRSRHTARHFPALPSPDHAHSCIGTSPAHVGSLIRAASPTCPSRVPAWALTRSHRLAAPSGSTGQGTTGEHTEEGQHHEGIMTAHQRCEQRWEGTCKRGEGNRSAFASAGHHSAPLVQDEPIGTPCQQHR
jgi:hypothetical protein